MKTRLRMHVKINMYNEDLAMYSEQQPLEKKRKSICMV